LLPVIQIDASGDLLPTLALKKLTLPHTIQTIKANAFAHFCALEKIDFLGTADQWAEITFENERTSPTFLSENLHIQGTLFTSATLQTATKIQPYAFMNCKSLTTLHLGESVQAVAPNAFVGCDNLQANATYQGAQYLHFGNKPFRFLLRAEHPSVNNVTLHENTEIIACNAFKNCSNLQTVHWNTSVKSIGANAFFACTFLQNCILPESVREIGSFAFLLCQNANLTFTNPNGWFAFLKADQSDLSPISPTDLAHLLVHDTQGYSFLQKLE
jgi:hypothetical protein